jgi:hypothetical protein
VQGIGRMTLEEIVYNDQGNAIECIINLQSADIYTVPKEINIIHLTTEGRNGIKIQSRRRTAIDVWTRGLLCDRTP